MYTNTDVVMFTRLAGPAFLWDGVRGCSRPASDVRKALRSDLWARQGGICPQCGDAVAEADAEFLHLVARGPKVKGFIPGNVMAGHRTCNASTAPEWDTEGHLIRGVPVLTPDMLARPDLVPAEWTPFPVLRTR